MSKTKIKKSNLEKTIMRKVESSEISMKPHWYFVIGGILTFFGFMAFTIGSVYLTNLILFISRKHCPMGQFRFQQMLINFPWWILILAVIGIVGGIFFLRRYDFSYKKNFWFIILGFIVSIIVAAFVIDNLGLNDVFSRQGPMRGFYRQIQQDQNNQQQIDPRMYRQERLRR